MPQSADEALATTPGEVNERNKGTQAGMRRIDRFRIRERVGAGNWSGRVSGLTGDGGVGRRGIEAVEAG
jgi:hypothetical protein